MDLIESLWQILLGVAGLLFSAALVVKVAARQSESAFALLKTELDEEKAHNRDLNKRVTDIKTLLDTRTARIDNLESALSSVCTTLENLQVRLTSAEAIIEDKDRKIKDLETKIDECKRQNDQLFESNKELHIENGTYRKALTMLGIERAESKEKRIEDAPTQPDESHQILRKA